MRYAAGLLLCVACTSTFGGQTARRILTLEDRVAAQKAIEQVYWNHRIWPEGNPQPKPPLAAAISEMAIRAKVEDYIKKSNALAEIWSQSITTEDLQSEMGRMAANTRDSRVLQELFAVLGNDPFLIAETLARQTLVDRLIQERYASDARGDPEFKQKTSFDSWWHGQQAGLAVDLQPTTGQFRSVAVSVTNCNNDTWMETSTGTNLPSARDNASAIWTGAEMIVWGGHDWGCCFPDQDEEVGTGGRYNPALDSWSPLPTGGNSPGARQNHPAIWTGTEMIVWGGYEKHVGGLNTGGRYNPLTNAWTATSTGANTPSARFGLTAVWTGSEMIIWGGMSNTGGGLNTGGRYNPSADTWAPTATGANLPVGRGYHTAVWTGSEMVVWGGGFYDTSSHLLNTGGRYNPSTGTWVATSTGINVPGAREVHSAVWTGMDMIVWGGTNGSDLNSGGRYRPSTDAWTPTSTGVNCPEARDGFTTVWTGTEMIVWGGEDSAYHHFNTGGRYDPSSNTWLATSISADVPYARRYHTVVWTGSEMIVWGGVHYEPQTENFPNFLSSGGRYCVIACTPQPWYRDADGDGFGDPSVTQSACTAPTGYVAIGGDCDDTSNRTFPGAASQESANACMKDVDQDGYGDTNPPSGVTAGTDCQDGSQSVHPGAPEVCDNVDNDCNGLKDQADPNLSRTADSDGDGLVDWDEVHGIDGSVPVDGLADLPIQALPYGANCHVPDLFVEIDYMIGVLHSDQPYDDSLNAVSLAFWNSPVAVNGVRTGVALHWLAGEGVEHEFANSIDDLDRFQYGPGGDSDPAVLCAQASNAYAFGSLGDRQSPNCVAIMRARNKAVRYALMVHRMWSESGHARMWFPPSCSSSGFMVANGDLNDFSAIVGEFWASAPDATRIDAQAGTLMHELGHTLGLQHGGFSSKNCKPNYLSVMSYARQFDSAGIAWGLPDAPSNTVVHLGRDLDYSRSALGFLYSGQYSHPVLDETQLDENAGVGGPVGERTLYGVAGSTSPVVGSATGPIDWNVNGTVENPASGSPNINHISTIGDCDGGNDISLGPSALGGYDDWTRVADCLAPPASTATLVARSSPWVEAPLDADELSISDYLNVSIGSVDVDGDGVINGNDVCPLTSDPLQSNADADAYGDACDCLPGDGTVWAAPSEAQEISFSNGAFRWREPAFHGGEALHYDFIRAADAAEFENAVCIETNDASDRQATDSSTPPAGALFFYLARAEDICPLGLGSLGTASNGTQRSGIDCGSRMKAKLTGTR